MASNTLLSCGHDTRQADRVAWLPRAGILVLGAIVVAALGCGGDPRHRDQDSGLRPTAETGVVDLTGTFDARLLADRGATDPSEKRDGSLPRDGATTDAPRTDGETHDSGSSGKAPVDAAPSGGGDAAPQGCVGQTCSGHGRCERDGAGLRCVCESGYFALGMTCVARSDGPTVAVDFAEAQSPGAIRHAASGFLHGLNTSLRRDPITPPSLYTAVDPKLLRTSATQIDNHFAEDRRLRGGSSTTLMVGTLSGGWGYPKNRANPPWGASYTSPNYRVWLDHVVATVARIKAVIPLSQRIYDFWNEPNNPGYWSEWDAREARDGPDAGSDPDFPRFKECWKLTYRLIKTGLGVYMGRDYGAALDPDAKITAPGTAGGSNETGFTKDFMSYARAENVVPDYWNWHFGGTAIATRFADRIGHARAIDADRDVMILEYLNESDGRRPGRAAFEIGLLEQIARSGAKTGLVGAAQARWPATTELGNSLSPADGRWRRHGVWHVYASYAKMRGARAASSSSGPVKLQATASIDVSTKTAWILLGSEKPASEGHSTIGTVTLQLRGLKVPSAGGAVGLTLLQIPYADFGEVTDDKVDKVIDSAALPVATSGATVTFNWGRADNAYFAVLTSVDRL